MVMLAVVVPCYNEERCIEALVEEFEKLRAKVELHLIFVDDGSTDATGELLSALAAQRDWVKVLAHKRNQGIGASLRDGFSYALAHGYELIAQMDCDLTHPPELLREMMRAVESHDLAVASRYAAGGGMGGVPWHRVLLSRAGNRLFRLLLGLSTKDATSGFRLGRREVLERIEPSSSGFGIQLEMTFLAEKAGFSIAEVPFILAAREKGSSKFRAAHILSYIPLLLRLMLRRGYLLLNTFASKV